MGPIEVCMALFTYIRCLRNISSDPRWASTPVQQTHRTNIQVKAFNTKIFETCDCPGKTSFPLAITEEVREWAALKFQSFMKMCYVKWLLRYHSKQDKSRKYYHQIKKDSKAFFQRHFVDPIESFKHFLLDYLFNSSFERFNFLQLSIPVEPVARFADLFEFVDDFNFTVTRLTRTYDFPERVRTRQWYPLKTGCLFSHSSRMHRYMLRAKSPISSSKVMFGVTVLDNDELKLVPMYDVDNMWGLSQNNFGYKVFICMFALVDFTDELTKIPPPK
ncbi:unnamed protein product [Hermetia illucens]|uniref:Uncharacterized protein n=1 Tax=Hermetia illucens TaxID=343691 RepID=A0A7R8YUZ2_HERIL|nr:unnamed protein product [Hermetia illucens]